MFKHSPRNTPLSFQLVLLTSNVWNRHLLSILKSLHSLELRPVVDPRPWGRRQGLSGCLEGGGVRDGLRMRDGVRLGIIWPTNYMWPEVMFTTLTHLREDHPSFLAKGLLILRELTYILNSMLNLQWAYSFAFVDKQNCLCKMLLHLFYIWTFRELIVATPVCRFPNSANLIWLGVFCTLRWGRILKLQHDSYTKKCPACFLAVLSILNDIFPIYKSNDT